MFNVASPLTCEDTINVSSENCGNLAIDKILMLFTDNAISYFLL
jgi:hypothetical protein